MDVCIVFRCKTDVLRRFGCGVVCCFCIFKILFNINKISLINTRVWVCGCARAACTCVCVLKMKQEIAKFSKLSKLTLQLFYLLWLLLSLTVSLLKVLIF